MSLAKTESIAEIKARNKELINEVLQVYPEKTAKRRAKHLNVHEAGGSGANGRSGGYLPQTHLWRERNADAEHG